MNKEYLLKVLNNYKDKISVDDFNTIESKVLSGELNMMSAVHMECKKVEQQQGKPMFTPSFDINVGDETKANIYNDKIKAPESQPQPQEQTHIQTNKPHESISDIDNNNIADTNIQDTHCTDLESMWDEIEEIDRTEDTADTWGENNPYFKVLLSKDASIFHDEDIDYTVYMALKSMTSYDSIIGEHGMDIGYDTVNMKLYTLNDITNLVVGKKEGSNITRQYLTKQLSLMQEKGIIEIEKTGKKYTQILIKKVQKGEIGIKLTNRTIQALSTVLKSDAMKVYIYLLDLRIYSSRQNKPLIINAKTIFKGAFGRDAVIDPKKKDNYDLRKIYNLLDGLDSLGLVDKETKTTRNKETGEITKIYKINQVKRPREPK